jgi:hypothetical protein
MPSTALFRSLAAMVDESLRLLRVPTPGAAGARRADDLVKGRA